MHAAIVTGVSRGWGRRWPSRCSRAGSRCSASGGRRARSSRASSTITPPAISRSRRCSPPRHAAAAPPGRGQAHVGDARQQRRGRHADRPRRAPRRQRDRVGARDQHGGAGRHGRSLLAGAFPTTRSSAGSSTSRRARRRRRSPAAPVYGMSKAALEMLTRSIAAECSAPRFRCISLRPGIFETGHAGVHAKPRSGRVSERRRCFAASRRTGC